MLNSNYLFALLKRWFFKLVVVLMVNVFVVSTSGAGGWRSEFPTVQLVGNGVLTVFFMDIYKLSLFSVNGRYSSKDDFILEFEYFKPISKNTIVDASITELSKFDSVTPKQKKYWRQILNKGIVDMSAGETAAVSFLKTGKIVFYQPGRDSVSFNAPEFKKYFASIWLGKETSRPKLRNELLGQ